MNYKITLVNHPILNWRLWFQTEGKPDFAVSITSQQAREIIKKAGLKIIPEHAFEAYE